MDRYPPLTESDPSSLVFEQNSIYKIMEAVYNVLTREQPALLGMVEKLVDSKDYISLESILKEIHRIIPMKSGNELYPLLSTREQLLRFLKGERGGFGDCKFLTILTAFICIAKVGLTTVISIRKYSEHPVLFVSLQGTAYKISFLHTNPEIKQFSDDNPFDVSPELKVNGSFKDNDFQNNKSILFWYIREAIFVLDCINILRRCVVNYVLDTDKNLANFSKVIIALKSSGIGIEAVINYWELELERIQEMIRCNSLTQNPQRLRQIIIGSLRAT